MEHTCQQCIKSCTDGLQCEECNCWYHPAFQNIKKSDQNKWKDSSFKYICVSCRASSNGDFDYRKGLLRLNKDARFGHQQLRDGVKREVLLTRNITYADDCLQESFDLHEQDLVANAIKETYSVSRLIALRTTGDGNCLFNAFSLLLCGNEERSTELRFRCVLEMVMNREKTMHSRHYKSLESLCPPYDDDCIKCTELGQWASMWNIYALSNLLKRKVSVVYPAVNGTENYTFRNMNTIFKPNFVDPERSIVTIMWSSVKAPNKRGLREEMSEVWTPNHFVPLVKTTQPVQMISLHQSPSLDECERAKPPREENRQETMKKRNHKKKVKTGKDTVSDHKKCDSGCYSRVTSATKETNVTTTIPNSQAHGSLSDLDVKDTLPVDPSNDIQQFSSPYHPDLSTIKEESSNENATFTEDLSFVSPNTTKPCSESDLNECQVYNFISGPLKKFMDISETVELLNGPVHTIDNVPTGRKDGFYFIVNNESNNDRRSNGHNCEFWDDCGS